MKRPHRSAHARIWSVLVVVLPLTLFAILALKQTVPVDRPAVLIDPPTAEN